MSRGKGKGNSYERTLAVQLSLWWTQNERPPSEDVFWRTSGSGNRATVRGYKGKRTAGHYGDICATDHRGKPFIDLFTVEVKRGYSSVSVADLIDKSALSAQQEFEEWIQQICRSQSHSGSVSWLLVHKRDQRLPVVFFPYEMLRAFESVGLLLYKTLPLLTLNVNVKMVQKIDGTVQTETSKMRIAGVTLANFMLSVTPEHVRRLVE